MENEKLKSEVEEMESPQTAEDVQQEVESNEEQRVAEDVNGSQDQKPEPKEEPVDVSTPTSAESDTEPPQTPVEPSTEQDSNEKNSLSENVEVSSEEDPSENSLEATDAKPEDDQNEEDHSPEDDDSENIDFDGMDKSQVVAFVVELRNESNIRKMDRHLKAVRERFDELFEDEKQEALKQFLKEEGASEDDFEFKGDGQDALFEDHYNQLRKKRNEFFKAQENEREDNLRKKTQILEEIRELVDGEETDISIKKIRDLQDQWKSTGPVPGAHNKTLWANYNALLDRFYDARSIYFELKDLDRKKNLEAKFELCEKAEELDQMNNIQEAVTQLNDLHEEFKHIGPVPKVEQEALWTRFKTASDKIYVKRRAFVDDLKKDLQENLAKKKELVDSVKSYIDFQSDKLSEWNTKTKEILQLQEKWNAIGGMPRDKAKEVNKEFWSSFKTYFNNKNTFYKELDSHRDENLKLKMDLVEKAEQLKESKDWNKTAEELKKIQSQWREIGPVPDANKNEIFKRFKSACDEFFNRKRAEVGNQHKQFEDNFEKKTEICDKINALLDKDKVNLEEVYDFIEDYLQTGFVPRKALKKMHQQFDAVIDKLMQHEGLTDAEKDEFQINLQVARAGASGKGGGGKLNRQQNALKRQISNLENDINTYKTNIDFFASSKNADKLKKEFEEKISQAEDQLKGLKNQLKALKSS